MIKDTVIAILAGIAIAQRITQPGDPARVAVILVTGVIAFMILLELEDLWDKRSRILQQTRSITSAAFKGMSRVLHRIGSCFRWHLIQLYTWPVERIWRRKRRQALTECIEKLRTMGEVTKDDVRCM